MRIGLIITELYPGGAEKCFVNLACFLKKQGHDVAVWQLQPPPPAGRDQLLKQLDAEGIAWHSGQVRRAWHFPAALRKLRRELSNFQPDIVQSFLFHANIANVLSTAHLPCRRFGGARVRQPQWWRQRLQGWASRRLEKLVCVSQSVAEHCRECERVAARRLAVIPNGIELDAQAGQGERDGSRWQIPPDAPVILFVGRLTAQKGVEEFFVEASEKLLRGLPTHHLVLMGDGELSGRLETLRQTHQAGARIHLVGWQPNPLSWMRQAECTILPASYEGMPNVILEAMSLARPVVAFEVEGVRELVGSGECASAQLVPPGDWPAFSQAIQRLSSDADLRERCGQANRQRVAEQFQLADQLQKYLQLYMGGLRVES